MKATIVRVLTLSVVFTLYLAPAAFSQTPVFIPEYYDGIVYINNQPAPKGAIVLVKSHETGEVVGNGVVHNDGGVYDLKQGVVFNNDFVEGVDEGVNPGELLDWYVNAVLAYKPEPGSDKATPGGINRGFDIQVRSTSTAYHTTELAILFSGLLLAFIFFEAIFFFLQKKDRK